MKYSIKENGTEYHYDTKARIPVWNGPTTNTSASVSYKTIVHGIKQIKKLWNKLINGRKKI